MNDSYIVINGKRAELTKEQLKTLGVEVRKNPFERVDKNDYYYYVRADGHVDVYTNTNDSVDKEIYAACNHFNDKKFAEQVAIHQLLYRKLLKFAYDNECEDNQEWNKTNCHYYISYSIDEGRFYVDVTGSFKHNDVWFCSRKSAECAIKEIVEPFMKEHPDFVW